MSAARLVPMRWWHIEQAAALEVQLFGDAAWSAETFWSELARPETRCYTVALDDRAEERAEDQRVSGYAGLMVVGTQADVQTVAVAPSAGGRGLGGRLLRRMLDQARDAGARTVMLEVRADNDRALNLYERNGFERIARRSGYYGPGRDALILRRPA